MKIVTSEEMARLEKGGDAEKYMLQAGREIAKAVMEIIRARKLPKLVTLLVGKGNNGGDAYAAGICLLSAGIQVQAIPVFDTGSDLNLKMKEIFFKKRGRLAQKMQGVLLDGLLGTGLKGKANAKIAKVIREANKSGLPIVAIDIPSGLNGTTGESHGIAIEATETVALGFAKIGFFIGDGWNHVGKVRVVDFGLPKKKVEFVAELPEHLELPKIVRTRHKYSRGCVVGLAGSKAMSGAAKLAGMAALRGGAGIVKLFSFEDIGSAPLELICQKWSEKAWEAALKKAKSVFVGPGLGKKFPVKDIELPCVIDADALTLDVPKKAILTPHQGEAKRLFKNEAAIQKFCDKTGAVVVLKGAPTKIYSKKRVPQIIMQGDPGMATAGAGDVLTGLIAALLAQGMKLLDAAVLGATLHGIAGEKAAAEKTSHCMIASDLIEAFRSYV